MHHNTRQTCREDRVKRLNPAAAQHGPVGGTTEPSHDSLSEQESVEESEEESVEEELVGEELVVQESVEE